MRNPVGFDWQPGSGVLYASNNGPDHLGYELPLEYFSRVAPGSFHGMPRFYVDGERLRPDDCIRRPSKLVRVRFAEGRADGVQDLVNGFQRDDGKRWARPVGLAFGPDGALYFTSDGGIEGLFRLRWRGRDSN